MSHARTTSNSEDMLVEFTCTVTYSGEMLVRSTRTGAAADARRILLAMKPAELQSNATYGVSREVDIGFVKPKTRRS